MICADAMKKTRVSKQPFPPPRGRMHIRVGGLRLAAAASKSAVLFALSLALFGAAVPAASRANEYTNCIKATGKRKIEACTIAINAGLTDVCAASAIANRGLAYYQLGDYARAASDYDQAIALNNKPASVYYDRGLAREKLGDLIKAKQDFDEAIRLNSKFALAFEARADVNQKIGQSKDALADYDEAIAIAPDDPAIRNRRCWERAIAGGDLTEALADCDRSLSLRAGDPQTLNSRGFVKFRLGDNAGAIADLNAALLQNPGLETSLYIRGLAKSRSGDVEGGNVDIAAAKVIDSKIAKTYAGYGVAP